MGEYKSETERKAELQEKAISIRDYMQEPDTMRQLMAALPNWLRADRFIRLFYTALMKNGALMLCTKQSLLSSMIEAAQIGLEPVLGKAALIPYGNEVQFQPMYKGLMEVSRRFADIVITGHVVYECDEFDITWGDNEKLHHIPKFGPEREKSAKIGAYDIWKVGNEVRSRRFMTTEEIIYIRDTYSKPWQKSGKNSIWGKHENDMFLKTVIKGHCKMEPQCIEMERAVELDNRVELQRSQLGMGKIDELPMPSAFDFQTPEGGPGPEKPVEPGAPVPPGKPATRPPADIAKTMAAQSNIPEKDIREFISFIVKKQEKTVEWVEENALKSPESFIRAVQVRLDTLKKEQGTPGGKPEAQGSGDDTAHLKEFWNLRKGKGGKTGLKAYVSQHINRIYDVYSDAVRSKLIEKFNTFYPGETFPPRFQKPVTHETQEAQGTQGDQGGQEDQGGQGIGGAEDKAPFENPHDRQGEEGAERKPLTNTEQTGDDIRKAKTEEMELVAKYETSVESVMKFDKSGAEYTLEDLENFMKEMAHMEGLTYSSFQADVMRRFQFPDYFDKFISRITGRE